MFKHNIMERIVLKLKLKLAIVTIVYILNQTVQNNLILNRSYSYHTVFTDFVMTYLITAASYWFKFKFRFLCSLRPLFKKREEKGAYIRNKISPITFKWLKSIFKCLNSIQKNCCFEG